MLSPTTSIYFDFIPSARRHVLASSASLGMTQWIGYENTIKICQKSTFVFVENSNKLKHAYFKVNDFLRTQLLYCQVFIRKSIKHTKSVNPETVIISPTLLSVIKYNGIEKSACTINNPKGIKLTNNPKWITESLGLKNLSLSKPKIINPWIKR